ncbi:MAG: DegV family protein [Acholeplasmataceae bacterium]|nr:DegV family protein [Acholeplasmataceae bacterium]
MANKIAFIACSNAGLDYLDYPKDIRIFRSVIHFDNDDKGYDDFVDMDATTFYKRIIKDPNNVPKTSYVAPGKMLEIFKELEVEGYNEVLVITISSALSGLFEAVKRTVESEDVKIKVSVFDSKTLAYGQAYMVLEAHRMAKDGKSMKDILRALEKIRDNDKIYFAVDTLLYLVKNGRLSKIQGTLGTLLKLKPLLVIEDDGKVVTLEKIRTTHKAHERVLEKYFEDTKDKKVVTFISHAHYEDGAQWFKDRIQSVYKDREVTIAPLTPVVGAHTGPKGIGIGYIKI